MAQHAGGLGEARDMEKTTDEPQIETGARTGSIDDTDVTALGYKPELYRNRSMFTLLFQSLAIAAIPYGEGGPLISAIYGGGQLSIFVGWISETYNSWKAHHVD